MMMNGEIPETFLTILVKPLQGRILVARHRQNLFVTLWFGGVGGVGSGRMLGW